MWYTHNFLEIYQVGKLRDNDTHSLTSAQNSDAPETVQEGVPLEDLPSSLPDVQGRGVRKPRLFSHTEEKEGASWCVGAGTPEGFAVGKIPPSCPAARSQSPWMAAPPWQGVHDGAGFYVLDPRGISGF